MMLTGALPARVAEIISRYNMIAGGDRLGVAVSGGADSVVLLRILHGLSVPLGAELVVLHANHGLRGEESEADAAFVHHLAGSLGLLCVSAQCPVSGGNLEGQARDARRSFFSNCRRAHGLRKIALGHTRGDQAETVLHRLLRGTGLTGLRAMPFVSADGFLRPLLGVSRAEVRGWAEQEGIAWREDSSNGDPRLTRNRIRQETLPALARDYNPNLEAVLATTALLAQAEEEYWAETVERAYSTLSEPDRRGVVLRVEDLSRLPLALRRRIIRRACSEIRSGGLKGLDFEHVEGILHLCESTEGHERVIVPGADAMRSFEWLLITPAGTLNSGPRNYSLALPFGQYQQLPFGSGRICVDEVNPKSPICDKFKEVQQFGVEQVRLSGEALAKGPLIVRNWQPGDELHRPNHRSAEKVKTLFQEYRVRLWERRHWPVLMCGGEIVWVRGFGAARQFQATADSDRVRLWYQTENRAEERSKGRAPD